MEALNVINGKSFQQILELSATPGINLKVDDYNDLYMLSFTDESNMNLPFIRQMNGIILQKETNKLIHFSSEKAYDCFFKPTPGLICAEKDPYIVREFVDDVDSIEHFIEGCLIRVYRHNDEWQIGTSRTINAALSHWSSDKSFREMFMEALELQNETFEDLDPDYCYSYVLQHPENKICLDITVPYCAIVNRVHLETLQTESFTEGHRTDKNLSQVLEEVRSIECDISKNYIVLLKSGKKVKIINHKYAFIQEAMDNNPSIKWVYLESIKNGTWPIIRNAFKSEFEKFNNIDRLFEDAVGLIHLCYIKQNVKKEADFEVPKRYERTVAQLHGQYRRTKTPITPDVVKDKLLDLDTKLLYYVVGIST
jgi:hypothetical protein